MSWLTPAVRRRIYLALSALLPLAAVYGLIDQEQAALWVTLAAAILGTGGTIMAAANTPKPPKPAKPVDVVTDAVDDVVGELRERAGDLLGSATSSWLGAASSATDAWLRGRR